MTSGLLLLSAYQLEWFPLIIFSQFLEKHLMQSTELLLLCISLIYLLRYGYAVVQLVEALRYKPEGRGFDSRWSHYNFSVT
jgi:hypothetical protein